MKAKTLVLTGLSALALTAGWLAVNADTPEVANAADHAEAPGASADAPSDIADFYAWHDSNAGTLTMVLTYDGLKAPVANQTGTYDPDVVYGFHIDNTGDNIPNTSIYVRYGQNSLGQWGVQAENLPGEAGPVVGPVGQTVTGDNGAKIHTGLFDDPFFFDLAGYTATLQSGTLSFTGVDAVAGTNASAIVIEVPLAAASAGNTTINLWATTGRI